MLCINAVASGSLCDRYGAKRCLTVAVATCAIATLCFQATTEQVGNAESIIGRSCVRICVVDLWHCHQNG